MNLCSPDRIKVFIVASAARRHIAQSYWLCRGVLRHMLVSVIVDGIEDIQASKVQEVGAGGKPSGTPRFSSALTVSLAKTAIPIAFLLDRKYMQIETTSSSKGSYLAFPTRSGKVDLETCRSRGPQISRVFAICSGGARAANLRECESLGAVRDHAEILGRTSPVTCDLRTCVFFVQLALIQMERKGKNQTQTDSSGVFSC